MATLTELRTWLIEVGVLRSTDGRYNLIAWGRLSKSDQNRVLTFFPDFPDMPIKQLMWHIWEQLVDVPKCLVCGINYCGWVPSPKHYRRVCGKVCGSVDPVAKRKQKDTTVDRYGVDHTFKDPIIAAKRKASMIERHGVEYTAQSDVLLQKMQTTTTERCGCINYNQLQISNISMEMLNDSTWMHEQHITNQIPATHIAITLNVDPTTVLNYLHKHGITPTRYCGSFGERQVGEFIESLGVEIVTNTRTVISGELDIFIPSMNIAIEYCGLFWHCDYHDRMDRQYHKRKQRECAALGIRLVTLFEDEWRDRNDQCKRAIAHMLNKSTEPIIGSRKSQITNVDSTSASKFFDRNHIQGDGPGSLCIGLVDGTGTLIACAKFICKHGNVVVLNRYATSCRVPGGLSKIINHLSEFIDWERIESFADLRWSCGTMYDITGFTKVAELPVDYSYLIGSGESTKRVHKFNMRRTHLANKLPNFDPNLSEVVNCRNHGLYRIWNCGLLKYVKHRN